MTQEEVETLVLETVRRYSPNGKASEDTRIEKDLRLTELARQRLFASLVEAFNARGTNLPSRGYYLSNFNACPTVADVQSAINAALFTKSAPKGKGAHAAHAPKPAPAPESEKARTPEPAVEATSAAETTPAPDAQPAQAVEGTLPAVDAPKKRTPAKKKPAKKAAKKKPARKTPTKRNPPAATTEADGTAAPAAEPTMPAAPQDAPPAGPAVAA
jgi:hypothetical protein